MTRMTRALLGATALCACGLSVSAQETTTLTIATVNNGQMIQMQGLTDAFTEQHPNIKLVATTLREVHSTNRHDWAAVLWLDGKRYVSPTTQLDVIDRIGGGDGFAAGLFYGLINGRSPDEALRLGWAHGALLTTFPGDVTNARLEEVEALAKGGTARVQR